MRRLLFLLPLVAAAASAFGYTFNTRAGLPIRWEPGTVNFVIQADNVTVLADGTTRAGSIQTAMQDWNNRMQLVQLASTVTSSGSGGDGNRINEIFFSDKVYGADFGERVLAITTTWSVSGDRVESDVLFNTAISWNSFRGGRASFPTQHDLRRVAIHELGHAIGLGHPDEAGQSVTAIMNSTVSYTPAIDGLQQDDINGAQDFYRAPGVFGPPANDNFANATAITLNTSNTATVSGHNFASTTETGEPDHDPGTGTSGGSVWFKWTAPSGGSLVIDTRGSVFDTIVGAYSGSSLNALTQLAANDDESAPPDHIRTSRLTLSNLVAGTTYSFAVAGWGTESGALTLNLAFTPGTTATLPTITSQPQSLAIPWGNNAQFSVSASGPAPLSYQWQRSATGNGPWVDITNATSAIYSFAAVDLGINGHSFRCVVSNPGGSVTSTAATLTILGSVTQIAWSNTAYSTTVGGSVFFSPVILSGSPSPTYQWQVAAPNSATWNAIPGATTATYSFIATLSDDGNRYRLAATNAFGTAYSPEATLRVNLPPPPVILSFQTSELIFAHGETIAIVVYASGATPITYEWYRNGVRLPSHASPQLLLPNATATDSGDYHVVVRNAGGAATSNPVRVTVRPPLPPTFQTEPVATMGATSSTISLQSAASGTSPITYQWYRDGVPLNGATAATLTISNAQLADAGDYHVVATNPGGTAVSRRATVDVVQPALPTASISPHEARVTTGGSFTFTAATDPLLTSNLSYQWFKDGQTLPNETSSTLTRALVTSTHAGAYHCVITLNGVPLPTPSAAVTVSATQRPWITARRHGDIVYFLTANPAQITRFDLASETWLPALSLPGNRTPTAMVPTSRGVFIAYGTSVVLLEANQSTETPVATALESVVNLFTAGDFVFFRDSGEVRSVRISTLAEGTRSMGYQVGIQALGRADAVSVSPDGTTLFAPMTTPAIGSFSINPSTGAVNYVGPARDSEAWHLGSKSLVSPDGSTLIDSSGVAYSLPSLAYRNATPGPMDDMAFLADGTLVTLRSATVTRHNPSNLVSAGAYTMPIAASALFARGDAVYAFSAPSPSPANSGVFKVSAASMTVSSALPTAPSPSGQRIDVLQAFVSPDGIVNIVSRALRAVVRWNPDSQTLLPSLALRAQPATADYDRPSNRLLLGYQDGTITEIPYEGSVGPERAMMSFSSANRLHQIMGLNNGRLALRLGAASNTSTRNIIYGSSGQFAATPVPLSHTSPFSIWDPTRSRLYYANGTWTHPDSTFEVNLPGAITSLSGALPPFVADATAARIVSGNGRIYADSGSSVGLLPYSQLTDAVWQPAHLLTIGQHANGTVVRCVVRANLTVLSEIVLPGVPVRALRLDDNNVIVLTASQGYLSFFRLPTLLSGVTTFHTGPAPADGPVITASPASATVDGEGTAQLSVSVASGAGATYRWYSRSSSNFPWSEVTNSSPYSGANTATLTITAPSTQLNGSAYRVRVINSAGLADSAAATLTVRPSQRAFLTPLFSGVLGRSATANDLTAYTAVINGGRSRRSVLDELLASQEFANRYLPEVIRMYYAAFGRAPDHTGLLNWSNHIRLNGPAQHQQVAAAFVGSAEFTVRYGNPTNAEFIRQLYRNVLAREAAQTEVDSWVALLDGGMARSSALFGFAESDEFKRRIADEVEVTQLYFVLLGRVPTAAELRAGLGALRGHGLTSAFLGSEEFATLYPNGLSDVAFVELIFQGFLRRPADTAGSAAYVAALGAGTLTRPEAVAALLDSAEAANNVIPAARLYLAGLQRPPDSGGLSTWAGQLRSGVSSETMGAAFASSQEFLNRYGGLSNQAYVQALYRNVLGRDADSAGLTNWTAALDSNAATRGSLLLGFANSQESISLYATDVRASLHYLTFLNRVPGTPELAGWYDYLTTLRAQFRQQMLNTAGLGP